MLKFIIIEIQDLTVLLTKLRIVANITTIVNSSLKWILIPFFCATTSTKTREPAPSICLLSHSIIREVESGTRRNKKLRREWIDPVNDSNDLEAVGRVAHQPRGIIASDGANRRDDRFAILVARRATIIHFNECNRYEYWYTARVYVLRFEVQPLPSPWNASYLSGCNTLINRIN